MISSNYTTKKYNAIKKTLETDKNNDMVNTFIEAIDNYIENLLTKKTTLHYPGVQDPGKRSPKGIYTNITNHEGKEPVKEKLKAQTDSNKSYN